MNALVSTIDEIIRYGLATDLEISNKEKLLEKYLVKLYLLYFDTTYEFDEYQYEDCEKTEYSLIRKNVEINFQDFGFYKTTIDILGVDHLNDHAIGDAIDDLTDIIIDLLEVKWRIENNSHNDGLWFFQFIFKAHTQQHILDLLNYMKQKNG